ncbi:transcription factor S [Candidatus Woesearchaeota archaeon]|nr:transcription factor S [Candidatus Woesearchaeota archaeon]
MFCPKCSSLLLPRKEKNKTIFVCSCGYKSKSKDNIKLREVIKKNKRKAEPVNEDYHPLPLTDAECPKCKHKKAFYWLVQTRASDEAETKFYKCEKCKHIWREYG